MVFSKNLSAGILLEALWDRFFPLFCSDLHPFSHSEGAPARLLTPRVRIWTSQKLSGGTARTTATQLVLLPLLLLLLLLLFLVLRLLLLLLLEA